MNTTFNMSSEENFNAVMNLSECSLDYETLLKLLDSDKLVEKQYAILTIDEIKTKDDAAKLADNLSGQDGKIREATAFKINEFIKNEKTVQFFLQDIIFDKLLDGVMDINGNVCRMVVDVLQLLSKEKPFLDYFIDKLIKNTNQTLEESKKLGAETRQYVISKRNFQLYWCLESIFELIKSIEIEQIKNILLEIGEFEDYTIREKAAKLLSVLNTKDEQLLKLADKLKQDENYYVRRFLAV